MTSSPFDSQPRLSGETLSLLPLQHDDFGGLYAAASDPETWAGHPATDRYKGDVFSKYFDFLLNNGGTLVILDNQLNRIIGCSRYYVAPDIPDGISIGFTFLHHDYWGGPTNKELKKLMLAHAFKTFSEVWFHIDASNIRSQKATAKLGAKHIYDATIGISGAPGNWMCFSLGKDDWDQTLAQTERAALS